MPDQPDALGLDEAARHRAERRAFIRAAHPDAGGDPRHFVDGLARFESPAQRQPGPAEQAWQRPTVHRSNRPDRVVLRAVREFRRRASGTPPRRLQ